MNTLTPRTPILTKRTGRTRVAFYLSMPNVGSWNGKWSGAGKLYVIVRQMGPRIAEVTIEQSPYYYRWSDGWGASIRAEEVDGRRSRELKKKSAGFCGYDWMVDSIITYGKIFADHEKPVSSIVTESTLSGENKNSVAASCAVKEEKEEDLGLR